MKENKGGTCIQIDESKAFDTVPHDAIIPVLTSKGVHPVIAEYIANSSSYADSSTSLLINKEEIPINIKRESNRESRYHRCFTMPFWTPFSIL